MTNTNLCAHFKCPHYSDKNYCERYSVAGLCPVVGVKEVTASQYFLSIDLDKTSKNSRDLIKYGIFMTGMEADEDA